MQTPEENVRKTTDDDKLVPSEPHTVIPVDRFNVLWLHRGHELTPIQRLGFVLWSCFFLVPGVACILRVFSETDP
jgi:hypothetical protein